jgi:hypothetical protein
MVGGTPRFAKVQASNSPRFLAVGGDFCTDEQVNPSGADSSDTPEGGKI